MHRILRWGARYAVVFGVLLVCAVPNRVRAKQRTSAKPKVVVLKIAEDTAASAAEERFVSELRLALDRFQVVAVKDPSSGFAGLAFSARLDLIRDLSKKHRAVATVWVERWASDKMLLNLTAMSTGRALLKIVEVKGGPSAESELAFAAETLLGEAYLFAPEGQDEAVLQTVEKVKQVVVDQGRPAPLGGASLTLAAALFGPMYPLENSAPLAGGGFAWMYEGANGWFVAPGFFAFGGPKRSLSDGAVSGFGLQGELLAGIHFRRKRVSLGPALGVGVRYQRLDAMFGTNINKDNTLVGFRGFFSLDAAILLSKNLALALRGDVALTPNTLEFKRVSDEETLLSTSMVEGGLLIGLRYLFR